MWMRWLGKKTSGKSKNGDEDWKRFRDFLMTMIKGISRNAAISYGRRRGDDSYIDWIKKFYSKAELVMRSMIIYLEEIKCRCSIRVAVLLPQLLL